MYSVSWWGTVGSFCRQSSRYRRILEMERTSCWSSRFGWMEYWCTWVTWWARRRSKSLSGTSNQKVKNLNFKWGSHWGSAFTLHQPDEVKTRKQCRRKVDVLLYGLSCVVFSKRRVSSCKNRHTRIECRHYSSFGDGNRLKSKSTTCEGSAMLSSWLNRTTEDKMVIR